MPIVAFSTHPPSCSGYGETSVPPPAKLIRSGALARMIILGSLKPFRQLFLGRCVVSRDSNVNKIAGCYEAVQSLSYQRWQHFTFHGELLLRHQWQIEDFLAEKIQTGIDQLAARRRLTSARFLFEFADLTIRIQGDRTVACRLVGFA